MLRFLKLFFTAVLISTMLPVPAINGMTDEEKKQEFLKAREEMHTVEEPTPPPANTPKPKPAAHHRKATPTPEPTSSHHRKGQKHEEKERTPAPAPTRQPTPERETPSPHQPPAHVEEHGKPSQPPPATPAPTPAPIPRPTPSPTPAPVVPRRAGAGETKAQVIVQKSEIENVLEPPPPPEPHGWWPWSHPVTYRYLSRSVIEAIRRAPVARGRWRYIVVHNSGTRQGNAKIFDYYHRHTRKMPNGLAYHFVIGNGTSSGDGQIEIGDRWRRQINGGHVHSDFLNSISLGICLVGDFNRDLPTKAQLAALDELIRYLRQRCGKFEGHVAIVKAHKEINPVPTDCPGNRFPYHWLHSRFD